MMKEILSLKINMSCRSSAIENDESLPVTTPNLELGEAGLSSDEARIAIIKKLEALNYGEVKPISSQRLGYIHKDIGAALFQ